MSCHVRHLGFDRTGNSAIRSADPENPAVERNMKWIGSPVADIWPFEIRHITSGAFWIPFWGRGGHRGHRSYQSKERWWFPIGWPLWPLRYLCPFGRN